MQYVLEKRIPRLLVMTKKIERVPRRLIPGSYTIQVPVDFRHRAKQERQNKSCSANSYTKHQSRKSLKEVDDEFQKKP